ncbi:hypothetical protein [Longimicrobium sp.]|uniref:hypothetical protein n=1 Tax=Longimicrobium sp. TaxID=2029185 RepID=UPI002E357530|nr:hypothetical protein [Longimicrobium sp.]HEX6037760.1 hypothetical protein [Longimicrobium sp.]
MLKAYAGHSRPRGGATDAYVETRPPATHREVIQIPWLSFRRSWRVGLSRPESQNHP